MDKHEIAMKLMLEAIKQKRLKEPAGKGEEYNRNLAKIVGEMYITIFKAVNDCKNTTPVQLKPDEIKQQLEERRSEITNPNQ